MCAPHPPDDPVDAHIGPQALRYLLVPPGAMSPGADDYAHLGPMFVGSDLADDRNQQVVMASPTEAARN
jgi:hypothetical protein